NYLCLAPHAFNKESGVFGQLKSQMLGMFPAHMVAGLELDDSKLPADYSNVKWLESAMKKYRQAFFHSSDAYKFDTQVTPKPGEVGYRFTMLKLASPTIEAVRQAFLASDSRLRLAFERVNGELVVASNLPDPLAGSRPWLRSVTVAGGTSFFGGPNRCQTFYFNPDFTC